MRQFVAAAAVATGTSFPTVFAGGNGSTVIAAADAYVAALGMDNYDGRASHWSAACSCQFLE